jgi:hypothetical protein
MGPVWGFLALSNNLQSGSIGPKIAAPGGVREVDLDTVEDPRLRTPPASPDAAQRGV